ncbi:MAG TPA: hypothetical protein VHG71_04840 [Verrucomicrobiae bacterium]|nr:hypothetical protein [Verrucomicrobiae bacterium]
MNKLIVGICGILGLLISIENSLAIEGLQLSVQSSNVVLSWPSTNIETYLVQYRQTLNATDSWVTLTNYYPASSSNFTFFVHSNIVQYPSISGGGTNGGGLPPMPQLQMSGISAKPSVPMVKPKNGSGDAAPLAIYPQGFDFSNFLIYDPATAKWVEGSDYLFPLTTESENGGFEPMDSISDTNQYTGFYRVVSDGVHLFGITNGETFSGIVTIPVEAESDSGYLANLSLNENDTPVSGISISTPPFQLPLHVAMDTTQMSNGVHQITASARWETTGNGEDGDSSFVEDDSQPISINVYNEISFPNWMPEFGELGNTLLIRATSAHTNADWYIDVYDSQTNYVGTLGGHTDDGEIGVVWNLIGPPPNYINYTNDNSFEFVISTEFSGNNLTFTPQGTGGANVVAPPLHKRLEQWSGHGAWVAVEQHAWDNYLGSDQLYAELNGFIGAVKQVQWTVLPSPDESGNAYALHYGAGDPQGDTDWANFRNALYDARSRNVIYFGHGGPDGIGYNPADINRYITANEIANTLHTIPVGQTNSHSFRFVFLDGCSTAKGTLPESFGIFHKENVSGDDYADASLRYSAFVGWPKDKGIGILQGSGYINFDHVNFVTYIQLEMLGSGYSGSPQPIKQAIINASQYPNLFGFGQNSLTVYGFWGLTFALGN